MRSSLWIVPFVAIVLVVATAPLIRMLDAWLGWRLIGLGASGAQALYQTVITLTLSFMVFTFGNLLVAIQVASGQLTPRIIATALLRDNVVRYSVGLFVFTLVFAVSALNRLDREVPELVALIAGTLGIACMATFLFFIDYAARLLRPVSICARIGDNGLQVILDVYPDLVGDDGDAASAAIPPLGEPDRIVHHEGSSEIVLAVDVDTLVARAQRLDGVIEFLPQVGDFVAYEEPLFALFGGAAAIDEPTLRATVAFGPERTMEQDPLFGFRILVDIALKALSPAINDPTTGVLALDQIHRLLKAVGRRRLRGDQLVDAHGRTRVIWRTPDWEDFVHISFTEIRACGANNVQVARRLRALLCDLLASLPAHRHAALLEEQRQLDGCLETLYPDPKQRALAGIADAQGLGAAHEPRRASARFIP